MTLISFSPLQDGVTGVNAAATNNPLNTIYNDYNGNITDANIASNAAIAGSKVNLASIANPYKFSVYRNAALNTANNASAVVAFDTKLYDTGSNVDIVTNKGRFTAPIAGFYSFKSSVNITSGGTLQTVVSLYKNGVEAKRGTQSTVGASIIGQTVSGDIQLAANDYVEVYVFSSATSGFNTIAAQTYFDGFLVSAT